MQPGLGKKATIDSNSKSRVIGDNAKPTDKIVELPHNSDSPIKKNTILPSKSLQHKTTFGPAKQKTIDGSFVSEESDVLSKKGSFNEQKAQMMNKATVQKGNENLRRSFHFIMNTYNMISSALGLFGLLLQMIEVGKSDQCRVYYYNMVQRTYYTGPNGEFFKNETLAGDFENSPTSILLRCASIMCTIFCIYFTIKAYQNGVKDLIERNMIAGNSRE